MKRWTRAIALAVATLLAGLALAGCSGNPFPDKPAATLGDLSVTSENFYYYFVFNTHQVESSLNRKFTDFQTEVPESEETESSYRSLLEDAAVENAMTYVITNDLFEKLGLTLSEEDVAAVQSQIQGNITQFGSQENYEQTLANNGLSPKFYEGALYDYARINKILSSRKDTEGFAKADLMAEMGKSFVRVKHILIKTIDDTSGESLSEAEVKAAQAKVDSLVEQLKNGGDFDALMKEHGQDPGMEQMPDGYVLDAAVSFDPEFMEVAFKLGEGEIDVAKGYYGYHIIKRYPLEEKDLEATYFDPYEQITVGDKILSEKANAFLTAELERYRTENEVVRNADVVDKMVALFIKQDSFTPQAEEEVPELPPADQGTEQTGTEQTSGGDSAGSGSTSGG